MTYYKRKRRRQGTGQSPPERPPARESVQMVDMKNFNLRKEMDHIVEAATRGESRIVTVGALVFFSTSAGDAWVLDVEDNLALCLVRDFERCSTESQETAKHFSIQWEATFAIKDGCFWITGQTEWVDNSPSSHTPGVPRTKTVAYPTSFVTRHRDVDSPRDARWASSWGFSRG